MMLLDGLFWVIIFFYFSSTEEVVGGDRLQGLDARGGQVTGIHALNDNVTFLFFFSPVFLLERNG